MKQFFKSSVLSHEKDVSDQLGDQKDGAELISEIVLIMKIKKIKK